MKKRIIALLLAVTVIAAVFTACGKGSADPGKDTGTSGSVLDAGEATSNPFNVIENTEKKGTPFFSAFRSETIDGKEVTDELFKGNRVTMINIWGTFCSPCIREMPDLQKLSKDYESKGVKLIGIVVDTYDYTKGENRADKINSAKDIISQTGVEYMNVLPSASLNAAKLDSIISVPTTFFLNEKGELISSEVGSHSYDEWCRIIDRALERA